MACKDRYRCTFAIPGNLRTLQSVLTSTIDRPVLAVRRMECISHNNSVSVHVVMPSEAR